MTDLQPISKNVTLGIFFMLLTDDVALCSKSNGWSWGSPNTSHLWEVQAPVWNEKATGMKGTAQGTVSGIVIVL